MYITFEEHQHFVYKETQISHLSERDSRILSSRLTAGNASKSQWSCRYSHVCVLLNWKWFRVRDKYKSTIYEKGKEWTLEWIKQGTQQQGLKAELM